MKKILSLSILCILISIVSTAQEIVHKKRAVALLDLSARNQEDDSRIFGVNQMCTAAGFPYIITQSVAEAVQYGMIINTSDIYNATFTSGELDTLNDYVTNGGVWLTSNVRNANLYPLFGVSQFTTSQQNYRLNWNMSSGSKTLTWFDHPLEQEVLFGRSDIPEIIYSRHYDLNGGNALAFFDNNTAKPAIIHNNTGLGHTYLLGFSLRDVSLRNMLNHDYQTQRTYSNGFEPNADVFVLFLRAVFANHTPAMVWKHTSPGNSMNILAITHDIDSRTAMDTMLAFAHWEKAQGFSCNYNVTVRYFNDNVMSDFYVGHEHTVETVKNLGHKICSHSVGHFRDYSSFPFGTLGNTRNNYNPFNNGSFTVGGNVLAEIEISRDVLEANHNVKLRSFRTGHLEFPRRLADALDTLGIEYNSTRSTNDIGYSFPYPMRKNNSFSGETAKAYEISMTISDVFTQGGFMSYNWPQRVDTWVNAFEPYANNHSPVVLLVHPNRNFKLTAQQQFVSRISTKTHFWDVETYGDFWKMRENLKIDSEFRNDTLIITYHLNGAQADWHQSFVAEHASTIAHVVVQNENGVNLNFKTELWQDVDRMVIYNHFGAVSDKKDIFKSTSNTIAKLLPNPSIGQSRIIWEASSSGLYEVRAHNIMGSEVWSNRAYFTQGKQSIEIPSEQWTSGIYIISLFKDDVNLNQNLKLIRQ